MTTAYQLGWVSVRERMPDTRKTAYGEEFSRPVGTLTRDGIIVTAIYDGHRFVGPYDYWGVSEDTVTHWTEYPSQYSID